MRLGLGLGLTQHRGGAPVLVADPAYDVLFDFEDGHYQLGTTAKAQPTDHAEVNYNGDDYEVARAYSDVDCMLWATATVGAGGGAFVEFHNQLAYDGNRLLLFRDPGTGTLRIYCQNNVGGNRFWNGPACTNGTRGTVLMIRRGTAVYAGWKVGNTVTAVSSVNAAGYTMPALTRFVIGGDATRAFPTNGPYHKVALRYGTFSNADGDAVLAAA
jgi:hypothetical protein